MAGRDPLVESFVSRQLLRRALQQHSLPSTQVATEVWTLAVADPRTEELECVMRQFVGVIARLAKGTAQQRAGGGDIPFQQSVILEEDIWQAVHRLGLESHLGLQPPTLITSMFANECLLEDNTHPPAEQSS